MTDSFSILAAAQDRSLAGQFTWLDWLVVFGYLALTTVVGAAMAGKQATIRDFFLGGRKLPWYAVCGATIATEISAVTFVGVPAIVFGGGLEGNFKYMQLGLFGAILARVIVGYVFIPAYYKREIYSPYDYMANELGGRVRTMTTCLFILGGSLGQGARVYLTAIILDMIVGKPLFGTLADHTGVATFVWCIYLIGVIAVVWTWIGGITTVIWTDVMLFLVFLFGALVALFTIIVKLPGDFGDGLAFMFRTGWEAKDSGPWGRFTFFDFSISPSRQFTIWTAIIASTWGGLNAYGTDQMMVQRMFCCKGPREARIATIASAFSQVVTLTMLLVGVGLFAFYQTYPLTGAAAAEVARDKDKIFPVFILQQLPPGITGLVIAGIFAAALSTLVSVVAAYSQTTISAFYLPWRERVNAGRVLTPGEQASEDRRLVRFSRVLVIIWGVILCLMAQVADAARDQFPEILNLALAMAGYTGGALLAGFLLAFLKLGVDARGFMWSAPLSVFVVFALVWHDPWTHPICWTGAAIILLTWLWRTISQSSTTRADRQSNDAGTTPVIPYWAQILVLVAGLALMLWINYEGYLDKTINPETGKVKYVTIAWPWFAPIGSSVAFLYGYLLARRKSDEDRRGFAVA